MSKADEIFEIYGYKQVNCNPICNEYRENNHLKNAIFYEKENHFNKEIKEIYDFVYIIFDLDKKKFVKWNYSHQTIMYINMQEFQAISLKCRELGWIGGEDE